MSEEFDPLHRWLGIPPEERPVNHYRLLGLSNFEKLTDVIEAAADQRMAFVRQSAAGKHADQAQNVLNLLAAARVCLLNAEKKAAYDASLNAVTKKKLETRKTAAPPPVAPAPSISPLTAADDPLANLGAPAGLDSPLDVSAARLRCTYARCASERRGVDQCAKVADGD